MRKMVFAAGNKAFALRTLEKLKAFNPKTAQTAQKLKEYGVREQWLQTPEVEKTEDGRYYLSEKYLKNRDIKIPTEEAVKT